MFGELNQGPKEKQIFDHKEELGQIEQNIKTEKILKPEELGLLLFLLNKAAKRRRDDSQKNYEKGNYELANKHSKEKEKYYSLKNEILGEMEKAGLIKPVGVHQSTNIRREKERRYHDEYCDCEDCQDYHNYRRRDPGYDIIEKKIKKTTYFKVFDIGGFCFHEIADKKEVSRLKEKGIGEIKDLGDWMSSKKLRPKERSAEEIKDLENRKPPDESKKPKELKKIKLLPIKEVVKKLNSHLQLLLQIKGDRKTEKMRKQLGISSNPEEIEKELNDIEQELKLVTDPRILLSQDYKKYEKYQKYKKRRKKLRRILNFLKSGGLEKTEAQWKKLKELYER